MRALVISVTVLFWSFSACADDIPPKLVDVIKMFGAEGSLSNGVLRVRYKKQVVTQEIFRTFVMSSCYPLWPVGKKDGWSKARIERIEVVNQIGAQGFAIVGGRKVCADLGAISGDPSIAYIVDHAWVCVAGNPCRPRRPGESTSGD